ncbi:MAG: hypothetical protein M1815_004550 [Lichina confinis]|nr:MAG: hypothetical protein M1815_004550 [Lichina confinis]
MGSESPKIAVYSVADLKNTTDDALPNYLNSLKFKQSHYFSDVRHALGFTAVFIAAATFYLDYVYGWEKTKAGTTWAVIAYFVLNGALTLWIWLVESGSVYSGELKGTQLHIESRAEKHNPTYFITARYHERGFPSNSHTIELRSPFARWFDGEGHFVATHFQSWLATGIPVVGSADSSRVLPQASSDEKVRKGDLTAVNAGLENSPKTLQPARKRGVGGKR